VCTGIFKGFDAEAMKIGFFGISRLNRYIHRTMTRAVVAIIHKENRILVCQRSRQSRYALKWEFPGGKMEEGESVLDCLRRELREELAITIGGFDRQETATNHYDDGGTFEVTYCFVSRFTGVVKNNVFEDIRWTTLSELRTLDILSGNRPFVDSLRETDFPPE
jgi:mutator protein MutT